jgi:hypothetical protein
MGRDALDDVAQMHKRTDVGARAGLDVSTGTRSGAPPFHYPPAPLHRSGSPIAAARP